MHCFYADHTPTIAKAEQILSLEPRNIEEKVLKMKALKSAQFSETWPDWYGGRQSLLARNYLQLPPPTAGCSTFKSIPMEGSVLYLYIHSLVSVLFCTWPFRGDAPSACSIFVSRNLRIGTIINLPCHSLIKRALYIIEYIDIFVYCSNWHCGMRVSW